VYKFRNPNKLKQRPLPGHRHNYDNNNKIKLGRIYGNGI
jgi:hypothetical protein